jgi:hypothetical protein
VSNCVCWVSSPTPPWMRWVVLSTSRMHLTQIFGKLAVWPDGISHQAQCGWSISLIKIISKLGQQDFLVRPRVGRKRKSHTMFPLPNSIGWHLSWQWPMCPVPVGIPGSGLGIILCRILSPDPGSPLLWHDWFYIEINKATAMMSYLDQT